MTCTDGEISSTQRRQLLDRTVANQLTTGGHAVSVDDNELQVKTDKSLFKFSYPPKSSVGDRRFD